MPPTVSYAITLPDTLLARVHALDPDANRFCLRAIERALRDAEMPPEPKPDSPPKKTGGRPLKGDRVNITVYVERRYVIALDALATQRGCSRADVVNSVLENAIKTGALTEPTDG